MVISVIGLGKLGSPLLATIAKKGFEVIGVDVNGKVIDEINQGKTSLNEPQLFELLKKNKQRISATLDIELAVKKSDITFIIVPTPSEENGAFSLKFVTEAAKKIGKALKEKQKYHLVVLTSTVMPGSTKKMAMQLEKISGKVLGRDFGVCYNPEFIALGSVINDLLNPDFVLIGESDKKSGDFLQSFYRKYSENNPKISRMNFVNAELTKISVNTFITTKISYANMLSEICEKLEGGNVDVVTEALGLDSRIGKKYLKGALPFGGPCFPRDNVAFAKLAESIRVNADIPLATQKTNRYQILRLTKKITSLVKEGQRVAVLGLSYKPFTDVIEESAGLLLVKELIKKGVKLNLHDPLALDDVSRIITNKSAEYFSDIEKALKNSQVLVITTSWPEYSKINKELLNKQKFIIDPWRILDPSTLGPKTTYVPFGVNHS